MKRSAKLPDGRRVVITDGELPAKRVYQKSGVIGASAGISKVLSGMAVGELARIPRKEGYEGPYVVAVSAVVTSLKKKSKTDWALRTGANGDVFVKRLA